LTRHREELGWSSLPSPAFRFPRVRAQQFICKRCGGLSNVQRFEKTRDGLTYALCEHCGAGNRVVDTGATASRPGLLPVIGLIDQKNP
jgi:hypothetical protein